MKITMIDFNSKSDLINYGFEGFISYSDLNQNEDNFINKVIGVYLVINPNYKSPIFLNPGICGKHKKKNPNYPIKILEKNYLYEAQVMYIGKGGSLENKEDLNSRLKYYLACSRNATCKHAGGRSIWQLKNYNELIFCWKYLNDDPGKEEDKLIKYFENQFGELPFANMRH